VSFFSLHFVHAPCSEAVHQHSQLHAVSEEVRKVAAVVAEWRAGFSACGVSHEDIEFIAPAMLPTCFLNEVPPRPVL